MKSIRTLLALSAMFAAAPLAAQDAPTPPPASTAPAAPPRLIVAISVDQFSADLFAEYRQYFTGGLARLSREGVVFPSGYQSHAATETCPGHSTILTGAHPARTGIIANNWVDLRTGRDDKTIYCAEDETTPGSTSSAYTVSDVHLRVPTFGEWMKAANPASRVVSVAGKDRAAVMMGGHDIDQLWWWDGSRFRSYAGRSEPTTVTRINTSVAARIAEASPALALPDVCRSRDRAIPVGNGTVGTGRFARAPGDARGFRTGPEADEAVLALAAGLADEMQLGKGSAPDLLIVGASATDYVGHSFGTGGTEMCLQLLSLDQNLGKFFAVLDASGVDYGVVLTADHGGHDVPERNDIHGAPSATRLELDPQLLGGIGAELGIAGQLVFGNLPGDLWIRPGLSAADHARVAQETIRRLSAHDQVAAVFTRAQVLATPMPHSPSESWSLIERARASFDTERSGDLVVALKPRVTPIGHPAPGYAATHGSYWDYDRRVPILFWRRGMPGFEQPLSVETVDIAPTLAAWMHVPVPVEIDGRCLDIDASERDLCE